MALNYSGGGLIRVKRFKAKTKNNLMTTGEDRVISLFKTLGIVGGIVASNDAG